VLHPFGVSRWKGRTSSSESLLGLSSFFFLSSPLLDRRRPPLRQVTASPDYPDDHLSCELMTDASRRCPRKAPPVILNSGMFVKGCLACHSRHHHTINFDVLSKLSRNGANLFWYGRLEVVNEHVWGVIREEIKVLAVPRVFDDQSRFTFGTWKWTMCIWYAIMHKRMSLSMQLTSTIFDSPWVLMQDHTQLLY
jgi:hypothetical protein